MLEAFEQRLIGSPAHYNREDLPALADYAPATQAEADRILSLFERIWDTGPGEPASRLVSSLTTLAEHSDSSRDHAMALAIRVARSSGDRAAREDVALALFTGNYDSEFRQQILDAIIRSADPMMKEALVAGLARAFKRSAFWADLGRPVASPDETLFEPVLRAGADGLETNARELISAAQKSGSFASVLAQVIRQTTTEPGGLLATFAEQAASHADPRTAACQAFEIHLNRRSKSP